MTYKLLAIVALLASVALAQPFANAPVFPRYNYVQPPSSKSTTAVVEVVLARGWAFTATSDGVYGMNTSMPSYAASSVQFFDALTGVTQLFATGPSTLIAVANSTLVLYEHNQTAAWRAAWYRRDDLSFDVQQGTTGGGMSYLGPVGFQGLVILGSRNLVSTSTSWSLVFAFNMTTLDLVWNTTIGWDTTSFAPATYYGDQFVFIQAQNTYGGSSNVRVLKLWANNGTIVGSALDTGTSYFTTIGVTNTQLMVTSRYYIDIYDIATWTKLRNTVTSSYASYMLYQPIAVNNTWYALLDDQLFAFDYTTSAQLSWSPKTFTNSVQGAGMRFMSENNMTGVYQANLLMMEGCRVWVVNASGLVKLMEFTQLGQGASQCNPQAATFDWDWTGRFPMIDNVAHLSYTSSYGGTVIAINYTTGEVLGQATGSFNPVGRGKLDLWHRRMYAASTTGGIIQGFAIPPRRNVGNYSDFVAQVPTSDSLTTNYGFAYNATNMSSYYISEDNLYSIDMMGGVAKLAAIPNNAYYVYNNPLIVGQYFVFTASYGGTYYLYSYNSVSKSMTSVSVCSLSSSYAMFSVGTVVYGNCDSSSRAAISVDVSKTTMTVTSFGTYYGEGLSADSKHVTFVSFGDLYIFDITGATPVQKFKSSSLTLYSAPVLYGDNLFIAGRTYGTSGDTSTQLLKIAVPSGSITKLGKLYASDYTVIVRQNGVFGSAGMIYCIGTNNVTAFNMGNNEQVFSYGINQTMYGSIVSKALSPVVLSNGAVAFYTSNNYLQVVGGFKGGLAWSYAGASSTIFPITTDGTNIYFARNNQVVGADTYTGAVTSVSSFGSQTLYGYAIVPGVNETTVVGANGYIVFAATTPIYESPAGPNPSFPGAGGNNGGNGGGLLEEAKSKAWIAGVVIGVLVVIVVVVIIAKKKSEAQTFDDDYVPMNPSTQV